MNYIKTIGLFITISTFSLLMSTGAELEGWFLVYSIISGISGVAALVTTLIMFFDNLYMNNELKRIGNRIEQLKIDKVTKQGYLDKYKAEFATIIMDTYPQYEKEIFNGMSNNDTKELKSIMIKYPELKFDGVLNIYIGKISDYLRILNEIDDSITYRNCDIQDIMSNDWLIKTSKHR